MFGFNEFVILGGYKIDVIKDYFKNYLHYSSKVMTIKTSTGEISHKNSGGEDWIIHIVDTGLNTMTGSRLLQAKSIIGEDTFALTYGDGLADVNLNKLMDFHFDGKFTISLTSVQPVARFGALEVDHNDTVLRFVEKPKNEGGWVNGGFMICESNIFDYIQSDTENVLETDVLMPIADQRGLGAYQHSGFWKPMDTLRDKVELETMLKEDRALWKIW